MYLEKLQLLNFKNYAEANLEFPARINVLVGKNGSGKTNLLDSIYYLSMTKSAFGSSDQQCIRYEQNFFMVKGWFRTEDKIHELVASAQLGAKKIFREDQQDYLKLSEHIGKYPVILVAPDDMDIVREGSESRRRFFDGILSQLDKKYLDNLIQYNAVLKQRNSLLKMFQERGKTDWLAADAYDNILVSTGRSIFARRSSFVKEFLPVFNEYFRFIVENAEVIDLLYKTDLNDSPFEEGLRANRQRDLLMQRTTFGIHRDDYEFILDSAELKRSGSQGQQKSFVIALKLAQFQILEQHKGFKPILLLDDVFDKLDDFRIAKLLELIDKNLGQLFITDARPDRTASLLKSVNVTASLFKVEKGTLLSAS